MAKKHNKKYCSNCGKVVKYVGSSKDKTRIFNEYFCPHCDNRIVKIKKRRY